MTGEGTFHRAKQLSVRAIERTLLVYYLKEHGGNVTKAAADAGMLRSAFQRLLRRHNIKSADYRRTPCDTSPTESEAPPPAAEQAR